MAALVGVTAGPLGEARAQTTGLLWIAVLGVVAEGTISTGGLVTVIGSSVEVGQGTRSNRWFISSYIFGGLNAAAAGVWANLGTTNKDAYVAGSIAQR
ncbi:MAG: hypothetical protein R3B70_14120 [Polyangiaceae bacterium]